MSIPGSIVRCTLSENFLRRGLKPQINEQKRGCGKGLSDWQPPNARTRGKGPDFPGRNAWVGGGRELWKRGENIFEIIFVILKNPQSGEERKIRKPQEYISDNTNVLPSASNSITQLHTDPFFFVTHVFSSLEPATTKKHRKNLPKTLVTFALHFPTYDNSWLCSRIQCVYSTNVDTYSAWRRLNRISSVPQWWSSPVIWTPQQPTTFRGLWKIEPQSEYFKKCLNRCALWDGASLSAIIKLKIVQTYANGLAVKYGYDRKLQIYR